MNRGLEVTGRSMLAFRKNDPLSRGVIRLEKLETILKS